MKNIHILPTDKPSKVAITDTNVLGMYKIEQIAKYGVNQNIYITSDEKFVKDEYVTDGIEVIKASAKLVDAQGLIGRRDWKKIILTTDQDLIKDGVQAIDDEFLEWFVNNPNCEKVETIKIEDELISPKNPKIRFNALQDPPSFISAESLNNMILTYKYKIIIPKEEPKQETLKEEKCVAGCKYFSGGEIKHHKNCFYYNDSFSKMYDDLKTQQERSYSEEEVKDLIEDWTKVSDGLNFNFPTSKFSIWFEQFKKK